MSEVHATDPAPLPMSRNTLAEAISQTEMDAWVRVINKRRAEWTKLPRDELLAILQVPLSSEKQSPPSLEDLGKILELLLNRNFSRSIDRKVPPDKRRASWECVQLLLHKLDEANNRRNIESGSLNTKLHLFSSDVL